MQTNPDISVTFSVATRTNNTGWFKCRNQLQESEKSRKNISQLN